ncbi:fumarate hydratase class I [Spirochaetia bacterium]|nr:fumarate hydratase class I [Spirochaetia bacterium]
MQQVIFKSFEKTEFVKIPTAAKPEISGGFLYVPPQALPGIAYNAFTNVSFFLRQTHLKLLASNAACALPNEKLIINALLENAVIASKKELCLCQDSGTACVYAWKDEGVITGTNDRAALEQGIASAYSKNYLRASQIAAKSFFEEVNTKNNLPAHIHIEAAPKINTEPVYRFLFSAKGGGSANKTQFFTMTKALLEETAFDNFLKEKIYSLGSAACPPYRLAVVVGGSAPEENLTALKLATTEILDTAPYFDGGKAAALYRDEFWERRAMEHAKNSGIGAQFGGNCLCLDVRVLRLPRHAASLFVSVGVSCSAHRNCLGFIGKDGVFLEKLEQNPAEFLKTFEFEAENQFVSGTALSKSDKNNHNSGRIAEIGKINLDRPLNDVLTGLKKYKAGEKIFLNGKILVARDAAHLRWHKLIAEGKPLPDYLFRYPVFYAGPAGTPPGHLIGSLGPTTAGRMDIYAEELLSRGASLITIAKGNRSALWSEPCKKYGGCYLGVAGGTAALIASRSIESAAVIDYPDLDMEAVRLVAVKDLLAFL